MKPETLTLVRYYFATARVPVDVMVCLACSAESVISPAVASENGLPGRCAICAHRELRRTRYRVEGADAVPVPAE